MRAVFSKEFKNSMTTVTGPIFIAFVLFWFGYTTVRINLDQGYSQFEYTVSSAAFISLIAIPLLTMRSHAEEKRNGSDKLLASLPIGTARIVISKYLAALAVFAIPTAVLFFYPLILSKFGEVYLNTAWSSLLAYFLVGATLIALGEFISSMTESQVIAAIISFGSIIMMFMIGNYTSDLPQTSAFSLIFLILLSLAAAFISWVLTKSAAVSIGVFAAGSAASAVVYIVDRTALEGLASKWLKTLDVFDRSSSFFAGNLDLTAVVYYLGLISLLLFLTVLSVDKRRWN